jgi:hypothetical protein
MTTYVENMRNENGSIMTKAEIVTELVKSTLAGGYRYIDRAEECYNQLVKDGIYKEKNID